MIITKTCNTCDHANDTHCIGCEWDKSKGENTKWELKKNPIVIERAVLDKIRAEIEKQVLESLSDGGDDWFAVEKVNECLEIIDKYRLESEDKE